MQVSRRVGSILLFLSTFHIGEVVGKCGKKGGSGLGDAIGSSLDLPPPITAAFAITIVIAILTLLQLGAAATRLKKPILPEGTPTLPYQVGKLFPILLFSYLLIYLVWNILYAIFLALFYGGFTIRSEGFISGTSFVSHLSDVLFFAMLLSIIAYRQRIHLHPAEKLFNLKSFLDGWLLSVILILGVAQDAIQGAVTGPFDANFEIAIRNFEVAYQVFYFLGSVDVAVSSIMAYVRLQKCEIRDDIIRTATFFVTPLVLVGGIYRIIAAGISYSLSPTWTFDSTAGLMIANVTIGGIVSIFVAAFALRMGALPKPPKNNSEGHKV